MDELEDSSDSCCLSVGVFFAASATRFGKERTSWSVLELLVVVVFAHEAFGRFRFMVGTDPAAESTILTS
jgi:hypothetical protein